MGVERHDTREEEAKRRVMPRFSVWTRLVDGPELTTKIRKWKSLFSQLAFTKCLLALVTFQVLGLGRSIKQQSLFAGLLKLIGGKVGWTNTWKVTSADYLIEL